MDFGLYTALSGRRSWDAVRADRQAEIGYMKEMAALNDQAMAKEAAARQGVEEYLGRIRQAKALDFDIEKIKAVEEGERKKVIKGIQEAGGNYQKFLLGGGTGILNNYYNSIMQSDAMKNAQANKIAFAQYALDKQVGRVARPIEVNGKTMSMEEQLQLAQQGGVDKLTYNGSIKPLTQDEIRNVIESAYTKNRYAKVAAKPEDIYNIALEYSQEPWYAEQLSKGYEEGLKSGGQPIYFKSDPYPQSSGSGKDDKDLNSADKRDELIVGIQNASTQYAGALMGAMVDDDKVSNVRYEDRNGKKYLVLTMVNPSQQALYQLYASEEGKKYNRDKAVATKLVPLDYELKENERIDSSKAVKQPEPKELAIDLTDPQSYNNLNNLLNKATGYSIPIESLDVINEKLGRTRHANAGKEATNNSGQKYTVSGKQYTQEQVKRAADASGMSIDEYLKAVGGK